MPRPPFAEVIREIEAEQAAATPPPVADPAPAAPEPAEAKQAAGGESQTPAPAERKAPPQVVALTKYNEVWRQARAHESAAKDASEKLAAAEAKYADLEKRMAASMAQQAPAQAAAIAQKAEDAGDWIDKMLAAGFEVDPEIAKQFRAQEQRLERLEAQVNGHSQVFQTAAQSSEERQFNAGVQKLMARCPRWSEERLLMRLESGNTPAEIVADYDDVYVVAASERAQAEATPSARPAASAPPQITAAGRPQGGSPANESREDYLKWVRQLGGTSVH